MIEGARPTPAIQDQALFGLVAAAVKEARKHVIRVRGERGWLPSIYNFPEATRFKSGFPHLRRSLGSNVPPSSEIFGPSKEPGTFAVAYDEILPLVELFDYVQTHERLREAFREGDFLEPFGEDFFRIEVSQIVFECLDRLLHIHGEEFTDDQLVEVYAQLERGLLDEELPIEFVIPIALTPFETDGRVPAGEGALVERMSDEWQLTRTPERMDATTHPAVVSAATHALVLIGHSMPKTKWFPYGAGQLESYPMERIERFFRALRIVTGLHTGFAQMSVRPIGWAKRWNGPLPAIARAALVRRYPPAWDDFGWLADPPLPVTQAQIEEVGAVDAALGSAPDQLQLAASRFSAAMLREDEADTIIDLCIGLEAALGDESRSEITHKLALRTAALLAADAQLPADEVFSQVRSIYSYRSAVVHGSGADKKREIRGRDGGVHLAVDVAREYLRLVLLALSRHKRWWRPQAIDEVLILERLNLGCEGNPSPTEDGA